MGIPSVLKTSTPKMGKPKGFKWHYNKQFFFIKGAIYGVGVGVSSGWLQVRQYLSPVGSVIMTSGFASRLSVWPGFGKSCVVLSTQTFCTVLSKIFGSVPEIKYSNLTGHRSGVPSGGGIRPDVEQTAFCTTLLGLGRNSSGLSFKSCVIILCQIGAAPVIPLAKPFIWELSLLPTHVATTKDGV
jgi:hypothetical protein